MSETREQIKMDAEEARAICGGWSGNKSFEVVQDTMVEHKRWSVVHVIVIKRIADGKFFAIKYYDNATESQDEDPFNYDQPVFSEVYPIERLVTVYE